MKKEAVIAALFFIAVLFMGDAEATVLPVPEVDQQNSVLCWAASTESVLRYYNMPTAQCTLAEELRVSKNLTFTPGSGYNSCCDPGAMSSQGVCNQGASFVNLQNMLNAPGRGIQSTFINGSSEADVILGYLNQGRPMMVSWQWQQPDGPNGHMVVARGLDNGNDPYVMYMDPNPSWNNYYVRTLSWFKSPTGGTSPSGGIYAVDWAGSLIPTRTQANPSPSTLVYVNGYTGSYTAPSGTPINVYGYLNPNGYTDLADWWVAILINGMICYQTSDGGWACPQPPAYTPINPQIRARQKLENAAGYYSILSMTPPAGTYTICFGVDLNPNSPPPLLDNPLYYSCTVITIQP